MQPEDNNEQSRGRRDGPRRFLVEHRGAIYVTNVVERIDTKDPDTRDEAESMIDMFENGYEEEPLRAVALPEFKASSPGDGPGVMTED
jgi:hypothetical protein